MGKKSKQRKSNKVPTCCYHGCCMKKEFNNRGEHYKVLEDYERQLLNLDKDDADVMVWAATLKNFYEQRKHVVSDPKFGRFAIARITDDYLKGKDDDLLRYRLCLLLYSRYQLIPQKEGKDVGPKSEYSKNYHKYSRDVTTERGRINCMAREIPCDCMKAKRIAAKSMKKIAVCFFCEEEFSKELMLRCKGCDHVQYCSKECSIKDWPGHKKHCRE